MTNLNNSGKDRVYEPTPVRDRGYFSSAVARIVGYDGSRGDDVLDLVQKLANEHHRLVRLDQIGRSHGFETATEAMNALGRLLPPSLKLANFDRPPQVDEIVYIPEVAAPAPAVVAPVVETKQNMTNPRNLPLRCKSSRPLQPPRSKKKKS